MIINPVRIFKNPDYELTDFFEKANYTGIAVIVDENSFKYCYPNIRDFLPPHVVITISSGEKHKNITSCYHIWNELTDNGLDRKALVINLGGGVICDMGGFCASTYKRGIHFIQLPSTLLSMVDASIGGKVGVDFEGYKNHIGVFNPPEDVFIYTKFLETLSERQFLSGFAEVIKHCLIYDSNKWDEIRLSAISDINWEDIVNHSVNVKSDVVKKDPKEEGLRKILNYGHTLGHAIETFFLENYSEPLLHGEAIAIGMICESYISKQKGYISSNDYENIKQYILKIFGKVDLPVDQFENIISYTNQDKKNYNKEIRFSLLEQVGKANYNIKVEVEEMKQALHAYQYAKQPVVG